MLGVTSGRLKKELENALDNLDFSNNQSTYSGYTKLPNGITLQWGHRTANSQSGWRTIYFPIAFKNKCMFACIDEEGGSYRSFNLRNLTTTYFQSEAISVVGNEARWFAIGY